MKKLERPKRENGVDFISNMPDSILALILSRLPWTEEVIRTCILSKRWRNLWTSVPTIDIRYGGNLTVKEFKEFVNWVLVKKSVHLDRFHLDCSDDCSMLTVGRWIDAAVAKNVKQLELRFSPTEYIKMPQCLMTCCSLEVLRLNFKKRGLILPNVIGFPALRVLDFTCVCVNYLVDGNLVKKILENCPLLEELSLQDCLIGESDILCISCPNLKKLSISNLEDVGMCEDMKVSCPKLVDLVLTGHIAYNYFFESLDALKEAVIHPSMIGETMSVMFPGFYHVQSLSIGLYFFCQCIYAASDPSLPNLKTLTLSTTSYDFKFDEFILILNYYPNLESLKLITKEHFYGPDIWERLGGDARSFMTKGELKGVESLEYNGEKPKLVFDWHAKTSLEIEFSWGEN